MNIAINKEYYKHIILSEIKQKYPQYNQKIIQDIIEKCFSYINQSVYIKSKYNFHVSSINEHYLLVIEIFKQNFPPTFSTTFYTFEDAKLLIDGPQNKKKFIDDLQSFTQIFYDSKILLLQVSPPFVSSVKKDHHRPAIDIIKVFNLGKSKIKFIFSNEMMQGLRGERGTDHQIEQQLIYACLSKKIKKLKSDIQKQSQNKKRLQWNFNVSEGKTSKVLRIIVDIDYLKSECYFITCFFVNNFDPILKPPLLDKLSKVYSWKNKNFDVKKIAF